jgi:hypothetical protein
MPNQVQPPPPPAPAAPPAPPAKPTPPAPPAKPALPAVGDSFGLSGPGSWPKLDWLYDLPSPGDAAGKVVIHWFCAPKLVGCTDDLARIVTLKEAGRVYVIAYINGTKG